MIKQYYQQKALGACILISLVFFFTLFYIIGNWHLDWALSHRRIEVTRIQPRSDSALLFASLPEQHLFGASLETDHSRLPISRLQLKVTGIIKNEPETKSKTLISIAGSPSKIYHIGDWVDGIKIDAITPESVILNNNGKLEKLPLLRKPLIFKKQPNFEKKKFKEVTGYSLFSIMKGGPF